MSNPAGTPIWYELVTGDPEAAARFYGAVMGWPVGPSVMPGMDYRMMGEGGATGGMLGLDDGMAAAGVKPAWLMYLKVDDVNAAAREVSAAGGAVLQPPFDIEGVGRMALVSDPQGQSFYVMCPGSGSASEEESLSFSPTAMGRCAWNELATPDQAGAVAFYRDRFGWAQEGAMPMGEMGDYLFVQKDALPLGAIMRAQEGTPAGWNFTFRVPDAHAATDAIRAAGGTVLHGPTEVPGNMLVTQALDPEGLLFGVCSGGEGA